MDELFEIRNAFHLGNFQLCLSEAQKQKAISSDAKVLAELYMYRAYIALNKFSIPLDEITTASSSDLQAIKLYAEYLSKIRTRDEVLKDLEKRMAVTSSSVLVLMTSLIYVDEKDYESALRSVNSTDDLEWKELKKMQDKDEDATLTTLAAAWVNMAVGKEKLQEAFYIYQELIDKYWPTDYLLTGQAACLIQQGKYEDADQLLQNALAKEGSVETLINLVVTTQHLGKPSEISNRFVSQLRDCHTHRQWMRDYQIKDQEFDRLCVQYAI